MIFFLRKMFVSNRSIFIQSLSSKHFIFVNKQKLNYPRSGPTFVTTWFNYHQASSRQRRVPSWYLLLILDPRHMVLTRYFPHSKESAMSWTYEQVSMAIVLSQEVSRIRFGKGLAYHPYNPYLYPLDLFLMDYINMKSWS